MDTFNFMVALLLMMIAVQFNQNWLAFAILGIMVFTTRSISATVVLGIAMVVLYMFKDSLQEYWAYIFFGLIILALILGAGAKGGQPEYYSPDAYSGLMGGGGGEGY